MKALFKWSRRLFTTDMKQCDGGLMILSQVLVKVFVWPGEDSVKGQKAVELCGELLMCVVLSAASADCNP